MQVFGEKDILESCLLREIPAKDQQPIQEIWMAQALSVGNEFDKAAGIYNHCVRETRYADHDNVIIQLSKAKVPGKRAVRDSDLKPLALISFRRNAGGDFDFEQAHAFGDYAPGGSVFADNVLGFVQQVSYGILLHNLKTTDKERRKDAAPAKGTGINTQSLARNFDLTP